MEQGILITSAVVGFGLIAMLKGMRRSITVLYLAVLLGGAYMLQLQKGVMEPMTGPALFWSLMVHLVAINISTIILYAYDKSLAERGAWRMPERTLHAYAIAGGTPGAFVAQKWFRHKTKKKAFRTAFWIIFFLQCVALFVLSGQVL